mgnify:CR=1 FL=1
MPLDGAIYGSHSSLSAGNISPSAIIVSNYGLTARILGTCVCIESLCLSYGKPVSLAVVKADLCEAYRTGIYNDEGKFCKEGGGKRRV